MTPASFVCPACGRESFNPHDIAQRYCGACHQFVSDAEQLVRHFDLLYRTMSTSELRLYRAALLLDREAPTADERTVTFCNQRIAALDRELQKRGPGTGMGAA